VADNRKCRVSLLQTDVAAGEPERNYAHVKAMLAKAAGAREKPDLVVLPEMWNTGYALDRIGELADPDGERTRQLFGSFCREHGMMAVAGSVAERSADGVRNTSYVFGRDGSVVSRYSKIHLFGLMGEDQALVGGKDICSLVLEGIPAGVMICYDIRFPELARSLAISGVKLLIVPAQWPEARIGHWRTLLTARAIENQLYVIGCNRAGRSGGADQRGGGAAEFNGHSLVIDPWGNILAEAGEEEEILTAGISLDVVEEVRARIPVFRDRRPELYKQD
jgi:predicted amidohydrolase